ncbi:MAG: NTP transferase domain-containing protein [Candidatus Aenigmarchaeota archaeon]|nr:NTP transferase domain-containing protein [Candidatus Aenigmarchaeota archaeon]
MEKERVTITIEKKMLEKIDAMIDGHKIRNRSHAIEDALAKVLAKKAISTAFILAGGPGTRLRPITYEIPKALIPIHDRPMLEHQIDMLKKYDIRNIILAVGHKADKIKEYFGNGSKFGVKITYIVENKPMGTGGSLRSAKNHLNDSFVLLYVDTLMDPDIHSIARFHKEYGGMGTMLLVPTNEPEAAGAVLMEGNKITNFTEKPKHRKSALINAGLSIFEPSILDFVPEGVCSLEVDVFPLLASRGMLFGYPFNGPIYDIATPRGYERALKEWKG